ncbi:hypothetical protein ACH4E8_24135 [Streptomyces sp. NPDC017979]|uniref:hypothetical protein n=1 Tax=Streptomyces sp. NPDC017979 TaxID=3365024 RepID=UPI0037888FDF
MQLLRRKNLTGAGGLMAAAVAVGVLAMPGQAHAAEAAGWAAQCAKTPVVGAPGVYDQRASVWKADDPSKIAESIFRPADDRLSVRNVSGTAMQYTIQWTNASGTAIERTWSYGVTSGTARHMVFDIPDGRTVYTSISVGDGTVARCSGRS